MNNILGFDRWSVIWSIAMVESCHRSWQGVSVSDFGGWFDGLTTNGGCLVRPSVGSWTGLRMSGLGVSLGGAILRRGSG